MKRSFDLIVSVIALVLLSPLLLVIALLILVTMGWPVLFLQLRPGLNAKIFRLHKFRTLTNSRGPDGTLLRDEQRLTGLGRFLRRTSLDELPELWNVLRGEMSLVGPRPLLPEYLPLYSSDQARRHTVRPGITGWAQVNGRNAVSWKEKFELDTWYVDNRSFLLDLRILFATVKKVAAGEGISQPGFATSERFTGGTRNQP